MGKYLLQNAIAVDQLVNTVLGGYADETLSCRAFRADRDGKIIGRLARPVIDWIFFWQDSHCYLSYIAERNRHQLPLNFK